MERMSENERTGWVDRIVGLDRQPADQFVANPRNARMHPQRQRDAVRGSLNDLGWVDVPIVNRQTGYLLDGHERIWQALQNDNATVPYLIVDLPEELEAQFLATFDYITQMAQYDRDTLDELLRDIQTGEEGLQAMLDELAIRQGVVPPPDPWEHWEGMPEFENEPKAARTLYIHFATAEDVEAFIGLTGFEITEKTKSVWYPERQANLHMDKSLRYEADES